MKSVRQLTYPLLLSLTVAAGLVMASPQGSTKPATKQSSAMPSSQTPKANLTERGKYLVEEVARCPDCHTPLDANGAPDRSHWLRGGPVYIRPTRPNPAWTIGAPSLVGFPYSDDQGQNVLERGIGTNGIPIQPPMHAYHLHHEDAVAIIAYLRSLK
jgi:hypothetical protein